MAAMGDGGAMGSRTAGLLRQGREMGDVHLLEMLLREIMEILHTSGIHKQVGEPKKVRKKVQTFVTKKGESRVLAFLLLFFNRGKDRQYSNDCRLVQSIHTTN